MDNNIVTLIIGVAGIVGTLFSSIIGYFFLWKERNTKSRQIIFEEQFNVSKKIMLAMGQAKNYLIILNDVKSQHKDEALEDLSKLIHTFSEIIDEAAAVLPTEIWVELRKLANVIFEKYDNFLNGREIGIEEYSSQSTKIALLLRLLLGIDELTQESLKNYHKGNVLENYSELNFKKLNK